MRRPCILSAFVACLTTLLFLMGGDPSFPRDPAIRLQDRGLVGKKDIPKGELYVLDGELMFLSTSEYGQRPGGPEDPPLPQRSIGFLWDGQTLRAKIKPIGVVQQGDVSKKLLAKDGWYVTADVSTDPPHVILTDKPMKGSRWTRVDADYPGRYLIKNEDAPGKAAWLTMENEGKTYRGGVARKPILSAEKHRFSIVEANSGK